MEENERLRQEVNTLFISLSLLIFFTWICSWKPSVELKVMEISNCRKQTIADSENVVYEEGQSSESVTNVCNSNGPPHDYESSDTSLKLGSVQISVFFFLVLLLQVYAVIIKLYFGLKFPNWGSLNNPIYWLTCIFQFW